MAEKKTKKKSSKTVAAHNKPTPINNDAVISWARKQGACEEGLQRMEKLLKKGPWRKVLPAFQKEILAAVPAKIRRDAGEREAWVDDQVSQEGTPVAHFQYLVNQVLENAGEYQDSLWDEINYPPAKLIKKIEEQAYDELFVRYDS